MIKVGDIVQHAKHDLDSNCAKYEVLRIVPGANTIGLRLIYGPMSNASIGEEYSNRWQDIFGPLWVKVRNRKIERNLPSWF